MNKLFYLTIFSPLFLTYIFGSYAYWLLAIYILILLSYFISKILKKNQKFEKTTLYLTLLVGLVQIMVLIYFPLDYFILTSYNSIIFLLILLGFWTFNYDFLLKYLKYFLIINVLLFITWQNGLIQTSSLFANYEGDLNQDVSGMIGLRYVGSNGTAGMASYFLSVTLYFFSKEMWSNNGLKFITNAAFCMVVIILGTATGSRSFLITVLPVILFPFFFNTNFKKLFKLGAIVFIVTFIVSFFKEDFNLAFEVISSRFEQGFENRLRNENGILDYFSGYNVKSFFYGEKLIVKDGGIRVLRDGKYFIPHSSLSFYPALFGFLGVNMVVVIFYFIFTFVSQRRNFNIESSILIIIFVFFNISEVFLLSIPSSLILAILISNFSQLNAPLKDKNLL